jgi:alanyl-tRNA synthetase
MTRRLTGSDIRQEFVKYFVDRGHEHVVSAPLIPRGDPTLLFTSAGMVPFKQLYVSDDPPYRRAVSVQRCLRLSDLDEVGRTPYHGTFFEMLGNFSFGDYFKREAIEWGWDFLTRVLELPVERLWITVYRDDDAAADIWAREIGVPGDRIVRLGEEHNWWGPAGDSGPCGPDSEIHYDMGPDVGCGRPECDPGCDCDRFFEIWNLVFPQYLEHADGTREPLARPGIDTGMGFERLCSVMQGVTSLYETDVLRPLVDAVRREAGSSGELTRADRSSVWVIVDHARAATFAIAENILPSNEAQGYVVRRLIRRAVRRGLTLGIEGEFLYRIAGAVVEASGSAHPHLTQKREHIALVIKSEEERFHQTLASGTAALKEAVAELRSRGEDTVSGDLAFRLYDTYGFPIDLTREMAAEEGLSVDVAAFEREMEGQRARGRAAASFGDAAGIGRPWTEARGVGASGSLFVGYDLGVEDPSGVEGRGAALSDPVEASVVRARSGADPSEVEVVLSETPFYAESGGQVADRGRVSWGDGVTAQVTNVYSEDGQAVHVLRNDDRRYPQAGELLSVSVDVAMRRRVEKNHTATHLLQAALRRTLGDHVHQSGSWVGPDRLRFDFTHFAELSPAEIESVEDQVNAWIRMNLPVTPTTMALDEALERGAMALFDEKYAADVRVVCVSTEGEGAVSLELCGGTHVRRTGEIGSFAIVSEGSVASGVRRIEAVTGRAAVERAREGASRVSEAARLLRSTPDDFLQRLGELADEAGKLRKELARERGRVAGESIGSAVSGAREVGGIKVVASRTEAGDILSLRAQADRLREALGSGVGVLAAEIEGSAVVIAVVTDDLSKSGRVKAGDVVRRVAEAMGGRGGGRQHMAQGGGDASRIGEALEATYAIVEEIIGG